MPFVQMENISHFLRACQAPPLNLQQHDMFLTVDLYEQKDPAQVLQCIGAFSRAANSVNPSSFPTSIGPRSARGGVLSPQSTGPLTPAPPSLRNRGASNSSNTSSAVYGRGATITASKTGDFGSGRHSPTKPPMQQNGSTSPVNVSSWSTREHEGATSPAWNIAQYGYMGGASQGNLGIAFGGRRQITSAGPHVPSLQEKERRRKEKEAEAERQRKQMEEEERRRKAELEAEEERARLEEERRWEEEARRLREEERKRIEEEKRRWEEEERQWKLTEEARRKEEEEAERRLQEERQKIRAKKSDTKLRGQMLSQYQADQQSRDKDRIKELEKELELARQREAQYERERQGRLPHKAGGKLAPGSNGSERSKSRARSRSRPARPPSRQDVDLSRQDSWSVRDEQEFLSAQWAQHQRQDAEEDEIAAPPTPRPLPDPTKIKTHRTGEEGPPVPIRKQHTGSRPLPDPAAYASSSSGAFSPPPPPHKQIGVQGQGQIPQSRSMPLPKPPAPLPHKPQPPQQQSQYQQPVPLKNPMFSRSGGYNMPASLQQQEQQPEQQKPTQTFARELASGDAPTPPPRSTPQQQQSPTKRPPPGSLFSRPGASTATVGFGNGGGGGFGSGKPSGGPPKSLLEREMELERQRQREWEEAQKETAKAVPQPGGVDGVGGGIGGRWDVGQWSGYTGGDSQNRGQQGIGAGRRQIGGVYPTAPSTDSGSGDGGVVTGRPRGKSVGGPRPLPGTPSQGR